MRAGVTAIKLLPQPELLLHKQPVRHVPHSAKHLSVKTNIIPLTGFQYVPFTAFFCSSRFAICRNPSTALRHRQTVAGDLNVCSVVYSVVSRTKMSKQREGGRCHWFSWTTTLVNGPVVMRHCTFSKDCDGKRRDIPFDIIVFRCHMFQNFG